MHTSSATRYTCPLSNGELSRFLSWASPPPELPKAQKLEWLKEPRVRLATELLLGPITLNNLAKYCPHSPWPKQTVMLAMGNTKEVFFGGAAGGGKSDLLLMAALRHVDVPDYHALILRKNFTLLTKAGAIMDRSHQWLRNTDAEWNHDKKRWTFPSGAKIEFGFLERPIEWQNFLGTDYQFIGWDEFTEFKGLIPKDENNPYLCLFRSLRRTEGNPVFPQMGLASNPGGPGHGFAKSRFITDAARLAIRSGARGIFFASPERAFIPSLAIDNAALILDEYIANLMHLPQVTRERQMNGDWDAATDLKINDEWLRPMFMRGELIVPCESNGAELEPVDQRQCRRFATIDTAGTSRDEAEKAKGKSPSYSVVAVWDLDKKRRWLFLRHVWRAMAGWGELKAKVPNVLREWNVKRAIIENAHVGNPLAEELRKEKFTTELVSTVLPGMAEGYRGAKLERATCSGLLTMLDSGKFYIDKQTPWWSEFEDEFTSWTGHPDEPADQIDVSSYAAHEAKSQSSTWDGPVRISRPSRIGV